MISSVNSSTRERFDAKWCEEDRGFITPCYVWLSTIDRHGYAQFWFAGKTRQAYHVLHWIYGVEIPIGFVPDHLCDQRDCVRFDHLELVTPEENTRRQIERGRHTSQRRKAQATCGRCGGSNFRPIKAGRQCRDCDAADKRRYRNVPG